MYMFLICILTQIHGCHRSGNGQGKKILQGQGNVREFYSGSGKIGILEKSQGKLKLYD